MSAVVKPIKKAVSKVVDTAGDIVNTVVEAAGDVVQTVADTAQKVVQSAIDDPIGTIAKVAAVATGHIELLPLINAADVVAHGGDIEDALTAAAVSYVAPEVSNYVAGEIAGTAFGDALTSAAEATGIESLPSAVTRGIGTAATSTVAGVVRGQDFDDALASGAISGISSIVGRVVGSEADTGSDFADRIIGSAVGAATNAELRGLDVNDAISTAVANTTINSGIKSIAPDIKESVKDYTAKISSADEDVIEPRIEDIVQSALATETGIDVPTIAASDIRPLTSLGATSQTPVDVEAGLMFGEGEQGFSGITEASRLPLDAETSNLLGITKSQETKVDALGNVYDSEGNFIGYASDFGMTMTTDPETGGVAWQTEQGQVLKTTNFGPEIASPTPGTSLTGYTLGDQEGDYPVEIINNPDGSVTSVEANGTSYTFNVDGSITFTDYEGNQNTVGVQDPYEVDQQTSRDETNWNVTDPYEVDQQTSRDETNWDLSSLVDTLIGPITPDTPITPTTPTTPITPTTPTNRNPLVPFMAGAAIGQFLEGDGTYSPYGFDPYGFGWNPYGVNPAINGIAYGQQFFEPTYTATAAEGGLMSLRNQPVQYIQPTVPSSINTNRVMLEQDPTSSVQMYRHGGHLGSYSDGGRMLKGPGDGMSDDIPATIAGRQPARLANEEFVIPADVVSHLGNGSSEAGAKVLYKMMADVRKARTGKTKQASQIKPERFMPRR